MGQNSINNNLNNKLNNKLNNNEGFELWIRIIKESIDKKNIEPWNINISEIADEYIKVIKQLHKFDIRLSAEVILVGSILLKMKSQILYGECENTFEEEGEGEEEEEVYYENLEDQYIEELDNENKDELEGQYNNNFNDKYNNENEKKRKQKNITFNDLINTLKSEIDKVNKPKNKKISNKNVIYEIKEDMEEEEDISDIMEKLLSELNKEKKIFYQKKYQNKKELIKNFLPSLYLANDGSIEIEQKEIFSEIILKIKLEN